MAKKIQAVLELDTKKAEGSVNRFKGALAGLAAGIGAKEIIGLADQFTNLRNRINAVADTEAQATNAFKLIKQVAADTRSDLTAVGGLFTDITIATEELGLQQQQVAQIASTFSKTLQISGADAGTAAGAITQFGQALAAGTLRGDEFRSIIEANPVFLRAMAKALNVTQGDLKKLADEGALTSSVVVAAVQEMAASVDQDFGKTTATVSQSVVLLKNNLIALLGELESKTGIFAGIANLVGVLADNLQIVVSLMAAAFAPAIVNGVVALGGAFATLSKAIRGAAGAATILQAVTGIGLAKALTGLAVGTAAYLAMEAAIGDTAETTQDLAGKQKDVTANSAEQLRLAQQKAAADKAAKAQADEQARILARQLEDLESISDELSIGTQQLQAQIALDQQLVGLTGIQRDIAIQTADLEAQRLSDLRDLADLTEISNEQRLDAERAINEEYEKRKGLATAGIIDQAELALMERLKDNTVAISRSFLEQSGALKILRETSKLYTADEKRNTEERLALENEFVIKRRDLFNEEQDALSEQVKIVAEAYKSGDIDRILSASETSDAVRNTYRAESKALEAELETRLGLLRFYQQERGKIEDEQKTFGAGLKQSFAEFAEEVENQALFASRIFDTMTDGFTSAIMNFVETGKLSFKDLFQSLLAEIVKMLANRAFLALFSPDGGVFGSLFAGFFEHGGVIPPGKFGIAGEAGPELVRGPATVVSTRDTAQMMAGGAPVTYNINAVDARSFQQLVAADPEFIYNVTRAGARRMPAR